MNGNSRQRRVGPRAYLAAAVYNLTIAVRTLRKAPAFAVTAILTLGLGTGATAAVFSLLNGILLRPLPWRHPQSVGLVWAVPPSGTRTWLSAPEVEEIRRQITGFTSVAGFTDLRFAYVGNTATSEVQALAVSHEFFRVIGVAPALGRDFAPDDDHREAPRTAILSHALWQSQFGADPGILGQTIRLNDRQYTVIGIAPSSFEWLPPSSVIPDTVDLWVALEPHLVARDRSVRFLHAVARLSETATFEAATAELGSYGERLSVEFPQSYSGGRWTFSAVSFQDDVLRRTRAPLYAVFGLVLLVLVMACGNVANLLLARGASRRRELVVRSALGAGPAKLAGELMAEALILAVLGSVVGLGMATAVPTIIQAIDPAALPRLAGVTTDWRVGLVMLVLILFTTGIFAAFPLLERMRLRSSHALIADRSGVSAPTALRVGRALVIAQATLAVAVLVSTIFLADTFRRLQGADLGFDPERVLSARVTVFTPGRATPAQYYDNAVAQIERIPGVQLVGAVSQLPLSGAMLGSTFLAGEAPNHRPIDVDLRGTTAGYFSAMGIPVRRGRTFDTRDTASTTPVAVVDESFAQRLSPLGDVIGQRVRWMRQPEIDVEIIGVVGAVRHRGVDEPPRPTVYRPLPQYARTSMYFVVKTAADPSRVVDGVVAAIEAITPVQPVADIATLESLIGRSMSRARTSVLLTASLAALALMLAVGGVYGVLSFGVGQRRREFGVRLALGATPASIRRAILRDGLGLTVAGCVMGTLLAWMIVQSASSLLFESRATDPAPYGLGALFVVISSAAAFWLPARRASAVDPTVALRQD